MRLIRCCYTGIPLLGQPALILKFRKKSARISYRPVRLPAITWPPSLINGEGQKLAQQRFDNAVIIAQRLLQEKKSSPTVTTEAGQFCCFQGNVFQQRLPLRRPCRHNGRATPPTNLAWLRGQYRTTHLLTKKSLHYLTQTQIIYRLFQPKILKTQKNCLQPVSRSQHKPAAIVFCSATDYGNATLADQQPRLAGRQRSLVGEALFDWRVSLKVPATNEFPIAPLAEPAASWMRPGYHRAATRMLFDALADAWAKHVATGEAMERNVNEEKAGRLLAFALGFSVN